MRYLMMNAREREELWAELDAMPGFLSEIVGPLPSREAAVPEPGGGFSPVEQCWHLADLEREGFGERIRRLLSESEPRLTDFDGDRAAKERAYRSRSLEAGILAFREARAANLGILRRIDGAVWSNSGTQEGVGKVALCDLPAMMAQHDASHRAEILRWKAWHEASFRQAP